MKKYSWSFNKDTERWYEDPQDTIAECIAAAKLADEEKNEFVYIGINNKFVPIVDAEMVLEALAEQASDFAGEVGDDWEVYDCTKRNETDELSQSLSAVVTAWQAKYGYAPDFYAIEGISSYRLDKTEFEGEED